METIEPAPIEVVKKNARAYWDISERIARVLAVHRRDPLAHLFVMLGAYNCLGCERLEAQLERHAALLGPHTEVIKAMGGDMETWDFFQDLVIGDCTVSTPGVPLGLLFDIDPADAGVLVFRALALGPLPEDNPAPGITALAEGRSQWVDEAVGATVVVCSGSLCFTLDRTNAFHRPFVARLPRAASEATP